MSTPTTTTETIHLPHLPPTLPIHAALYTDLPPSNAKYLRSQLLAGNTAFEYALIDARMVVSRAHALAAVFRAVLDWLGGRLTTRNVHAEVVFALGGGNNIGDAFRRFGISESTTELLVFKIPVTGSGADLDGHVTADSVSRHLSEFIQGTQVPFTDEVLLGITDLERVRKIYKLSTSSGGAAGLKKRKGEMDGDDNNNNIRNRDTEVGDVRKDVEVQVLGIMAIRGAT